MDFNKRLRQTRMERKMTQQAIADAIKVELRTYQYYEQGVHEPNYSTLIALADVLDVSTDYLLGRKDQK